MKEFYLFYSLWISGMVLALVGLGWYFYKRKAKQKALARQREEERKSVKTKLIQFHRVK